MNSSQNYKLLVTRHFERTFRKLSPQVQDHLKPLLYELEHNPRKGEQLKGKFAFLHSLHTTYKGTHYRVIYQVNHQHHTVELVHAAVRENIYNILPRLKLKVA